MTGYYLRKISYFLYMEKRTEGMGVNVQVLMALKYSFFYFISSKNKTSYRFFIGCELCFLRIERLYEIEKWNILSFRKKFIQGLTRTVRSKSFQNRVVMYQL